MVAAALAGLDTVTGASINRFCASSLQTLRMAFHAISAGEGHALVSACVEAVARCGLPAAACGQKGSPAIRRGSLPGLALPA